MGHFDISLHDTAIVVIDMQEAFAKAIPSIAIDQCCGRQCQLLIQAAQILSLPLIFTEQYPKGLGATIDGLRNTAPEAPDYAKTHFSCLDDQRLREEIAALGCKNIIICGIEAHICVLSTAYDLIQRGYNTLLAVDAIASRLPENRSYAIEAMRNAGAICLPVESLLFRIQREAGTGAFKALSALLR